MCVCLANPLHRANVHCVPVATAYRLAGKVDANTMNVEDLLPPDDGIPGDDTKSA